MNPRSDPYLSLGDVFTEITSRRFRYCAIALMILTPAVLWAILARPIYQSEATIAIEPGQDAATSKSELLGSIASFAGMSLSTDSRRAVILGTLEARSTAVDFISKEAISGILMGARWDKSTGTSKARSGSEPVTPAYAYEIWKKRVIHINEDQQSSLITVAVDWYNPQEAAAWNSAFLQFTDSLLRNEALREAQTSIAYLNSQLSLTKDYEVRSSIAELLEQQLKITALAKARTWYALRVVDSPEVPIRKSAPNRALLIVLGIVVASMAVFLTATSAQLLRPSGRS